MGRDQIVARIAEIQNMLEGIQAGAEGYTEEQVEDINKLSAEYDGLEVQLSALEKADAIKAKASATQGRKTAPVEPVKAVTRVEVGASAKDKFGGFNSSGDFLMAVKKASTGDIDQRFKNVAYEKNGEDGGFLVPEDISTSIVKKLESNESLISKTRSITVSGNSMTFPLDESQPWNQGIQAYWTAEGAPITESKPKFTESTLRLHKVAALVKATDELLDDAVALESYIKAGAGSAIMYKVNQAIVSGNGVGKPQGFLNSPFTVTVAKESGQAADTVVARNIFKMYSALIPAARAGAAWYMDIGVEGALMTMMDDNDNFIYLAPGSQMNGSPYGMLLGLPVYPMMAGMKALGDSGDIVLANLEYYWTIKKSAGIKSATSIHLNFDREITAFRFSMRVDGRVPFASPVVSETGFQMSAFVKLADRA